MNSVENELDGALKAVSGEIGTLLEDLLVPNEGPRGRLIEAMRYACLGGGKRLRPFLVLSSARLFGVPRNYALRAGAAVELVHCYSLVHDDLPAMDDSDLRRGRPTVHRAYDEATAILVGDGLLTCAFQVLADPETHPDSGVRTALVTALAEASGEAGMVGGQMIDLSPERESLDLNGIVYLQQLKTGALFRFSCLAGAILGQADAEARTALESYARHLGLAFQIVDDLLDAQGTTEALGKPANQDAAAGKATFIGLLGEAQARVRAGELVAQAIGALDRFGAEAGPLRRVAQFVLERNH